MALINKKVSTEEQFMRCDGCGKEVKCKGSEVLELLSGHGHWHLYGDVAVCPKCAEEIILRHFGYPQELPFDDEEYNEMPRMQTGLTPVELEALMTAGTEYDPKPELAGELDDIPF